MSFTNPPVPQWDSWNNCYYILAPGILNGPPVRQSISNKQAYEFKQSLPLSGYNPGGYQNHTHFRYGNAPSLYQAAQGGQGPQPWPNGPHGYGVYPGAADPVYAPSGPTYTFSQQNQERRSDGASQNKDRQEDYRQGKHQPSDHREEPERRAQERVSAANEVRRTSPPEKGRQVDPGENPWGPNEPSDPRRGIASTRDLGVAFDGLSIDDEVRPDGQRAAVKRRDSIGQQQTIQVDRHVLSSRQSPQLSRKRQSVAQHSGSDTGVHAEGPNYYRRDPNLQNQNKDFRVRKGHEEREFFVVGRVFETAIPEGSPVAGTVSSTGRNEEFFLFKGKGARIFCKWRVLVVFKVKHGCSWCLLVHTYKGQGVAKRGLSKADRENHSIIHMDKQDPYQSPKEKDIIKDSIQVHPAKPTETLHVMSRLNYGKVYTIEHNVEARDIGLVTPGSMLFFSRYVKEELDEP